ncbi:MAG: hypothetical protein Q4F74_03720 [Synergistaceae bacterium]|nr:hypothetical protein [Synergistaceae bacterium]
MTNKLPELEKLLVSNSGRSNSTLMSAGLFAVGTYLLGSLAWKYWTGKKADGAAFDIIISLAAFFLMRYQKMIYIAPEGIVRELHTWISHGREIVQWKDIHLVTILSKKNECIAFFEKGTLSVKISFKREQIGELKGILDKYIPDVEVREIER